MMSPTAALDLDDVKEHFLELTEHRKEISSRFTVVATGGELRSLEGMTGTAGCLLNVCGPPVKGLGLG